MLQDNIGDDIKVTLCDLGELVGLLDSIILSLSGQFSCNSPGELDMEAKST